MGLISKLRKGGDDTATKSDDAAKASASPNGYNDPVVDQNTKQTGSLKDIAKDGTKFTAGQVASVPAGIAAQGRKTVTGLGLIGGGAYTASQFAQSNKAQANAKAAQSKQQAYTQLQQQIQAIRNNKNLSPEQKRQRIKEARRNFRQTWGGSNNGGGGGGGGPLSQLMSLFNLGGGGGSSGGLTSGILGKVFLGLMVLSMLWVGPKFIRALKGGR